jgi:ABC-type multidrug transport system permease subunit
MEVVEEQMEEIERERRAMKREIVLMIATLIFAGVVVAFISEPSELTGWAVMISLVGYAAAAGWACLTDRLVDTKRCG